MPLPDNNRHNSHNTQANIMRPMDTAWGGLFGFWASYLPSQALRRPPAVAAVVIPATVIAGACAGSTLNKLRRGPR